MATLSDLLKNFFQALLRRLSPYGIEIALSTLTFFVSDSDSSKLNGQQMVELKRGSTELKELLLGNDAAENDDLDEEFEINVYGKDNIIVSSPFCGLTMNLKYVFIEYGTK